MKIKVLKVKEFLGMDVEPWMIWVGAAIIILLIPTLIYNRFVYLRNKVDQSFRGIDISLEKRFDALTNLAESVASYSEHEQEIMTGVAKLRSGYSEQSNNEKVRRSNEASEMVKGLNVQVERYPNLKASKLYLQMQKSINEFEDRIAATRRTYNARVTKYNTAVQVFPMVIFAVLFGFSKRDLLQAPEEKKENVDLRSLLRG